MPRRQKPPSDPLQTGIQPCDWQGCDGHGMCRAPKNRQHIGSNHPHDYYWFCQTHIREFNKRWDYFEGMGEEEIIHFQHEAVYGHRPTWKPEWVASKHEAILEEALSRFYHGHSQPRPQPKPQIKLTAKERNAYATLELKPDVDEPTIRHRYKELAKKYHPDLNPDDKHMEERFKKVVEAYHIILIHIKKQG